MCIRDSLYREWQNQHTSPYLQNFFNKILKKRNIAVFIPVSYTHLNEESDAEEEDLSEEKTTYITDENGEIHLSYLLSLIHI